MPGPLDDVRVIDFTHALNGPFCTMLLGHMGAEVIKIEPPGGDGFRRSWMPPDAGKDSYEFLWINANKKSVVLNLKTKQGIDLARRLIESADILVENYRTGIMKRFGLDYENLKGSNPRLIYACSRGYGEWGPYSSHGNTAASNNSITGWTHTAWGYSGAPGTKALGIGDEAAGVSMALGILSALHERERSGEGQKIEVSMQEAVLGFMVSSMHEHFTGIGVGTTPMQVLDGYFTLRIPHVDDATWSDLADAMDQRELATDVRFSTSAARREHKGELDRIVRDWARGKTRHELWETLRNLGYFGAPVLSTGEVMEDAHIKARGAFIERDHPTAGPTKFVAPWIHMSKTPASIHDDAPAIGQHTDEVLGGVLGLTQQELASLRAEEAIE